eukprot:scaffold25367_cov63-Phaeocystis_antarctica.AAC.2
MARAKLSFSPPSKRADTSKYFGVITEGSWDACVVTSVVCSLSKGRGTNRGMRVGRARLGLEIGLWVVPTGDDFDDNATSTCCAEVAGKPVGGGPLRRLRKTYTAAVSIAPTRQVPTRTRIPITRSLRSLEPVEGAGDGGRSGTGGGGDGDGGGGLGGADGDGGGGDGDGGGGLGGGDGGGDGGSASHRSQRTAVGSADTSGNESQVLQRGEPPSCEGCCRSGRCCQGSCKRGVELGGRVEGRPRGQIQGGGVPCPYPFVPAVLPAPLHSPPRRTPPPYDRPLVAHGG